MPLPMPQSPAFDRTQFGNVLDKHPEFRASGTGVKQMKAKAKANTNVTMDLNLNAQTGTTASLIPLPLPPATYTSCSVSSDGDVGRVSHFAMVRLPLCSGRICSPVSR
jgi:hypothetical protein